MPCTSKNSIYGVPVSDGLTRYSQSAIYWGITVYRYINGKQIRLGLTKRKIKYTNRYEHPQVTMTMNGSLRVLQNKDNYSRIYLGDWERPLEFFVVTTDFLEQDFRNKELTS
jgi:hypothetical protein